MYSFMNDLCALESSHLLKLLCQWYLDTVMNYENLIFNLIFTLTKIKKCNTTPGLISTSDIINPQHAITLFLSVSKKYVANDIFVPINFASLVIRKLGQISQ